MPDPLDTYIKPGFPKKSVSERSYRTTIEYAGPYATLLSGSPQIGATFGDYIGTVSRADIEYVEGNETYGFLVVDVEAFFDAGGATGSEREVTYEVEWVMFQRSLYEHPQFAPGQGGSSELSDLDIAQIEAWRNEEDTEKKGDFKFGNAGTELSANAQLFAKGLNLGIETYEDFAPIIRKTTHLVGGNPADCEAGEKGGEPSFTGKPDGYEWRKTADRGVKSRGQARWDRVEEWAGAVKVLIDREKVYWDAT